MNKIEIRHSCIIIHNYESGDNEYIEKMFSIFDKLRHRYYYKGIYYDYKTKDLYLPSGIDFFYIAKNFGNDIFNKVYADEYTTISPVLLKYPPRDDVQLKAIRFCVGEDPYRNNINSSQIGLNLNTGKGKTYVAIAVMAYFRAKTIMITSSLDWINQWKEKILEYTNIKEDEIYIISGSASIAKLIKNMVDIHKIKFFLCSHDTIRSFASKYSWNDVHKLFKLLKIGIKIYDEAHLYFDNICMIDFFSDVWKTFYLTASPSRSDFWENKIYQRAFKTVPKINLFDEENDPHTEYIALKFNSHPRPQDISNCQNQYGFDRNNYTNYFVLQSNIYFKMLKLIMEMILASTSKDGKALIYIGTNKAIQITYDWLRFYYFGITIGIFTSLVPKSEKRNQLNNKIILTTTKSAGAALDIEGLEMTIIFNEPFKSKVIAQQTLGRTRASNTKYIDLVDVGFKTLSYYYKQKKPIFAKYATKMTEVVMSDYDIDQQLKEIYKREKYNMDLIQQRTNLKQIVEVIKK